MADSPMQMVAEIAENPRFYQRCLMIAMAYAVNTVLAAAPQTGDENSRHFASMVVRGSIAPNILARVVLGDPNIQAAALADYVNMGAAVADVNIDGRIQAVWNSMANAFAE